MWLVALHSTEYTCTPFIVTLTILFTRNYSVSVCEQEISQHALSNQWFLVCTRPISYMANALASINMIVKSVEGVRSCAVHVHVMRGLAMLCYIIALGLAVTATRSAFVTACPLSSHCTMLVSTLEIVCFKEENLLAISSILRNLGNSSGSHADASGRNNCSEKENDIRGATSHLQNFIHSTLSNLPRNKTETNAPQSELPSKLSSPKVLSDTGGSREKNHESARACSHLWLHADGKEERANHHSTPDPKQTSSNSSHQRNRRKLL